MSKKQWGHGYYTGFDEGFSEGLKHKENEKIKSDAKILMEKCKKDKKLFEIIRKILSVEIFQNILNGDDDDIYIFFKLEEDYRCLRYDHPTTKR